MFSERIIENKQKVKLDYQFFKRYNKKYPERGGYKKMTALLQRMVPVRKMY